MDRMSYERRVLTYGCFDGQSTAQMHFLRRVATMGERLIVGLASDALAPSLAPALGQGGASDWDTRQTALAANRFIDRVLCWEDADQIRTDIVNYNAALLVMDRQWAGQFDALEDLTQVIYLSPTLPDVETTSRPQSERASRLNEGFFGKTA
jgi:glycerol-3-phosphate cytidylyltransferase